MSRTALPLASHGVLRTEDVDLARAAISASLAPHRLRLVHGGAGFRARHNSVDLGGVGLHALDYGAETEVVVEPMDAQLVQIPLGGRTAVDAGGGEVVAGVGAAALTPVGRPLRMRYSAGNPRVVVEVPAALLRERTALAGLPAARPGTLDLTRGAGRSWRALVDLVLAESERPEGLLAGAVTRRSLGLAVVDGLVAGLSAAPGRSPADGGTAAALVRRAVRLIEEHCAEQLGTADVAEALGVPPRTLQAAFRAHLGSTPSAHLRRARLDRVRAALLDGSAGTVTEAAQRWGVPHLGRLAADYRDAFGEAPAETLRRGR